MSELSYSIGTHNPFDVLTCDHDYFDDVQMADQQCDKRIKTIYDTFQQIVSYIKYGPTRSFCFTPEIIFTAIPKMIRVAFEPLIKHGHLFEVLVGIVMEYAIETVITPCIFAECDMHVKTVDYTFTGIDDGEVLLPVCCTGHDYTEYGYCGLCLWGTWESDTDIKVESTERKIISETERKKIIAICYDEIDSDDIAIHAHTRNYAYNRWWDYYNNRLEEHLYNIYGSIGGCNPICVHSDPVEYDNWYDEQSECYRYGGRNEYQHYCGDPAECIKWQANCRIL
ncbi:MAG: hypothetical protein Faunusvirus2_64 [Faunusvirus sp.]|jgi:hypothetical protein|uniref:Uncharacterized protein n=1 Tax=Faunusvirus sp. TaxID=2487766 RepID=A0A3G4ZW38_9VIRU|nr:MAG: hypothetical protein Faunusvirus2_64 [Faunusvirus sp.]